MTGRVLVMGAGRSGSAAARFLAGRGARVEVWDDREWDALPAAGELREQGVHFLEAPPDPAGYDLAVISPGIPPRHPLWQALRAAGVPVVGEVELAARELGCPLVAVTGTNGKTTVALWAARILEAQGLRVFAGGNLGRPLVEAVGETWDVAVVEVSSFQLAATERFRPRVAVLLNVAPDHLDWHPDLDHYRASKARIFRNQGPGDAAVVNADDPRAWEMGRRSRGALLGFSGARPLPAGAWFEGKEAVFCLPGADGVRVGAEPFGAIGLHNRLNALAACLAAAWVGADVARAWECVRTLRPPAHRLEPFLDWRGIRFVDDSKATNVAAARTALQAVDPPVVWVAGGRGKGQDFSPLAPAAAGRVRRAVLVGEAAAEIARALDGAVPVEIAPDWPGAVARAVGAARPGDTVLLAPACSSFDHFSGYEERGQVFQRLCRGEVERRSSRAS